MKNKKPFLSPCELQFELMMQAREHIQKKIKAEDYLEFEEINKILKNKKNKNG